MFSFLAVVLFGQAVPPPPVASWIDLVGQLGLASAVVIQTIFFLRHLRESEKQQQALHSLWSASYDRMADKNGLLAEAVIRLEASLRERRRWVDEHPPPPPRPFGDGRD